MLSKMITTQYQFPSTFNREFLNFAIQTLNAELFSSKITLQMMIEGLREQDFTIGLKQRLVDLQNKLAKHNFMNSYVADNTYVITNTTEFDELRTEISRIMFRTRSFYFNLNVILEQTCFLLKNDKFQENNLQVEQLNAFGKEIDSLDGVKSQLAVDNLKAIKQFYHSIGESVLVKKLVEADQIISNITPVISLGSVSSNSVQSDIEWLPVVAL